MKSPGRGATGRAAGRRREATALLRATAQTCLSANARQVESVELATSEVGRRFLHDLVDGHFNGISASVPVGGGLLKGGSVEIVGQQRQEGSGRGSAQAMGEECAASQHHGGLCVRGPFVH